MKPFFSIRIDYNPSDSRGQSHRDGNSARITVARQCDPSLQEGSDDESREAAATQEDRESIVDAITRVLRFADRAMNVGDDWDLLDEVMKSLATVWGGAETVRYLLETTISETDDEDLDALQAIIDKQRAYLAKEAAEEPDA